MISVCIPTYNGESFIEEQIKSVLIQLEESDEIIVSDDSSTDRTIEIIKNINDRRIRIVEGNTFHSPIYNLENALKEAKGDYIFLCDQDDIWIEKKVKICLDYLGSYDCVVHDAIIIDSHKQIILDSFFKIGPSHEGIIHNLITNGYLGCCMAFRSSLLEYILPFPDNIPMHDIWIGNIAALFFRLCFIPEKLIYYRRHGNNASPTAEKSKAKLIEKIMNRYTIISNLIKRRKSIKSKG